MEDKLQRIKEKIFEARRDVGGELETSSYNEVQFDLIKLARFRLKQAWHLLDEAAEL